MFWWMERIGALDQTLNERPDARERPNPLVTGVGGGHEIDLRDYAAAGVTLLGHLRDVTGSRLHLADDLEALLAAGDESIGVFTAPAVDAYIARSGLAAPEESPAVPPSPRGGPGADSRARSGRFRHHGGGLGHRLPARLRVDRRARLRQAGASRCTGAA